MSTAEAPYYTLANIQPSGALIGVRALSGWFSTGSKPGKEKDKSATVYACRFHVSGSAQPREFELTSAAKQGKVVRFGHSVEQADDEQGRGGRRGRTRKIFARAPQRNELKRSRRRHGEAIVQVDCYYGELSFVVSIAHKRKGGRGKKAHADGVWQEISSTSLRLSSIAKACQNGRTQFRLDLGENRGVICLEMLYFKIPYRIKQDPEGIVASMVSAMKDVIQLGYSDFARVVFQVIQNSSVFFLSRVLSSRQYLDQRMNLLEFAASLGRAEIIKSILKRSYSPLKTVMEDTERCSLGKTALHLVAESEQIEAFEALVDGKCSWLANRYLARRLDRRNLGLADRELLDLTVNPGTPEEEYFIDKKDESGCTAIAYVAASKDPDFSVRAMKFLIARGANITAKTTREETPLVLSIKAGNVQTSLYLLGLKTVVIAGHNHSAQPNMPDATGRRPLMYACMLGNLALVQRLLQVGATLMIYDREGSTPLHEAAAQGHVEVVKVLLCELGQKSKLSTEHASAKMRSSTNAAAPLSKLLGLFKARKSRKDTDKWKDGHECTTPSNSSNEDTEEQLEFSPEVLRFITARRWRCGRTAFELAEEGLHLEVMHTFREYCGEAVENAPNLLREDATDDEYSLNASFCMSNRSHRSVKE